MTRRIGRYELLRPIASGGMARVYLGRAHADVEGFERLVAIKVMHAHVAESAEHVAMFLDEARLAARIRHPNVVATLDIVQDAKVPFIVMEFIEGPSLHRMLKLMRAQKQTLPLDVACRIFTDMLTGLHAAHELKGPDGEPLKLVHRDVSPQNVLVGSDGISRLTDFGVARAEMRISETRAGQLKGKIRYMPPEQIRGSDVDRRADVYAAGVVLWEVLVGKRLFSAKSEGELVLKLVEGAKKSPRQLNPSVPEAIDQVCMQALKLDRAERHPSAAALAEALESAAIGERIPVASSRRLAAYVESLEQAHGAPDPSGIRWLPSGPAAGGTPSGMSLYSRNMVRPIIRSSEHPSGTGPPPLPSTSGDGLPASGSVPSSVTPSGSGTGTGPLAPAEQSASGSVTSPTDAALLAATAPLGGGRHRWLLPAIATTAAVVAAVGVWTALGLRGEGGNDAGPTGSATGPTGSALLAGDGSGEHEAISDAVQKGDNEGGEAGGGATASAASGKHTSTRRTGGSHRHEGSGKGSRKGAHAAAPRPTHTKTAPKSTHTKTAPKPTHTAHHRTPPPTATTTTSPKKYHPDDL